MRKVSTSLHEIPENGGQSKYQLRQGLNKSVVEAKPRSPLKPINRMQKRAIPLYKQIEMQYEA